MTQERPRAHSAPAPGPTVDAERMRAGHVLRRLGFGPSARDLRHLLAIGIEAWIEEQLDPASIDDHGAEARFRKIPLNDVDRQTWIYRWYTRMVYSRRQLQEKMTLLWHEHFSNSLGKINYYTMMRDHEQLLRDKGLGNFRDLLVAVTRDNAMLVYLDNNFNDGQARDDEGERVPPNENYARELLQLYSLGTEQLAMDGTPLTSGGMPLPTYGERDVKEIARALTGWIAQSGTTFFGEKAYTVNPPAVFHPEMHDPGEKIVLGEIIPAAAGEAGAEDVERVVDVLMRQPSMAPFISKQLIQKLATETPTPAYVERVAAVFAATSGDLRAAVRAVATDEEFFSDAVVRSQYREPVEQFVGAIRALGGRTSGVAPHEWCTMAGQSLWFPPSVFSFYRPGHKSTLVTAGFVAARDQIADAIANGERAAAETSWDARAFIRRHGLRRHPERTVDALADALLAAPLRPEVRDAIAAYVGSDSSPDKVRGAAWVLMTAPEFQVN